MTPARHSDRVCIHSPEEIEGIRAAAAKAAWVRDELSKRIRPGLSTLEIDSTADELIAGTGGEPAFRGYRGFPGTICVSVDDEVVHGIGVADRIVQAGSLVSFDVGVRYQGFVGDTAWTVCLGPPPSRETALLLVATRKALEAGIGAARAGSRVNDIGRAVEKTVAEHGFSVVRDFVGHGCGCRLHEPPEVPNFETDEEGPELKPGMVLAIEPMVNAGTAGVSVDGQDGWTVRTRDGKLSAHMEHMVLIGSEKTEILTWPKTQ